MRRTTPQGHTLLRRWSNDIVRRHGVYVNKFASSNGEFFGQDRLSINDFFDNDSHHCRCRRNNQQNNKHGNYAVPKAQNKALHSVYLAQNNVTIVPPTTYHGGCVNATIDSVTPRLRKRSSLVSSRNVVPVNAYPTLRIHKYAAVTSHAIMSAHYRFQYSWPAPCE
jgi:hypothetical protein